MISHEELLEQLRAMPSSLNDACRTMEVAAGEIARLCQCIRAAMGCLDAENPDERLAWLRLLDGMERREPRMQTKAFDVEGKLNFLAGCALGSDDGWTYLNEDARIAIKEAAKKLREQAREIERLTRNIST